MTDGELKSRIVEIYLTASELCGAGLAGLSGTDPVNEINNHTSDEKPIFNALYEQSCQYDRLESLCAEIGGTNL